MALPYRAISCIILEQHSMSIDMTSWKITEWFTRSGKLTLGMAKSQSSSRILAFAKISIFFLDAKWTSTFSEKLLSLLSLSSDAEINMISFRAVSKSEVHLIIFWKSGSFDASVGTTWKKIQVTFSASFIYSFLFRKNQNINIRRQNWHQHLSNG